jgi:hypothetical protein
MVTHMYTDSMGSVHEIQLPKGVYCSCAWDAVTQSWAHAYFCNTTLQGYFKNTEAGSYVNYRKVADTLEELFANEDLELQSPQRPESK